MDSTVGKAARQASACAARQGNKLEEGDGGFYTSGRLLQ